MDPVSGARASDGTEAGTITHRSVERKTGPRKAIGVAALALCGSVLFAADPSSQSRTIAYQERGDIPTVYTLLGFQSEVVLPKDETVVLTSLGTSFFLAPFVGHTVIVKALDGIAGKRTDLRVLTASGNEYTFIIEEVSKKPSCRGDLKVYVTNADAEAQEAMHETPKLYTADQVQGYQKQLADAQAALIREQDAKAHAVQVSATKEANSIRHDYELYARKGEDFHATVYRDNLFTYVEINSQEAPALYEVKDGKLSLIEKQLANGRFTIPKIVDEGVLKVGKSQVKFRRTDS